MGFRLDERRDLTAKQRPDDVACNWVWTVDRGTGIREVNKLGGVDGWPVACLGVGGSSCEACVDIVFSG